MLSTVISSATTYLAAPTQRAEVISLDTGELLLGAGVSIDQLFDLTGVNLEGDGYDTVGGFLYERLGKIPKVGDSVVQDSLSIEVMSASGRRLKKLQVTKKY